MCKVRDAGKIKARDRIAVLAALNLAFEQTDGASSSTGASTQEASTPEQAAQLSSADSDRLAQLLKRLDQALHQDGQLI
jgi:cell division protein ZapA